ncbi:MAG: glycosyltransferase family 4 protein [Novosphingobium sp.]
MARALMPPPRRPILFLVANQAWNLVNYRSGLIRALSDDGWEIVAVAPAEPAMAARLMELGCRFEAIPLDAKGLSPLAELRTFVSLWRLIRRHRPQALLSWTIKANLWSALAARLTGTAAIVNVSGLGIAFDGRGLLRRLAGLLYRVCLARAAMVFFQNETDRDALVGTGLVRAKQARLLPGSGVDPAWFAPAHRDRPASRRYVLIARLLAPKGVREFVAAARLVRPTRPELRFALVGFLDVANATAIPRCEVEGWVGEGLVEYYEPVDDVRPLLDDAEAVVLPSYYREGLSRALLEAAAMARPAITTDWPGCREAVVDGVTGFLCAPRDPRSLADAIERLAALDEAEWRAMGDAARARIEREFTESVVIDRYREALASAFTSSRSRSASS